jgi:carboxymethylenebutenolidase
MTAANNTPITPIKTPDQGLKTHWETISTGDAELPVYVATPDKPGPFPVVLVIQEVFGVHEHIQDVCRRFAHEGFMALAPELYVRQGKPADYPDIPQLIEHIVSKVPDQQVMSDLDA